MQFMILLLGAGLLFTLVAGSTAAPASEFYVSPAGNDAAAGSEKQPCQPVDRARAEVRKRVVAGLQEPITVFLRSGIYKLTETLTFGPDDAGTEAFAITYDACCVRCGPPRALFPPLTGAP